MMSADRMTAAGRPREWDAAAYDALPLPHERWGRRVLGSLPLRGDECVLDAGAGTGRDTAALLGRLPRGRRAGPADGRPGRPGRPAGARPAGGRGVLCRDPALATRP